MENAQNLVVVVVATVVFAVVGDEMRWGSGGRCVVEWGGVWYGVGYGEGVVEWGGV